MSRDAGGLAGLAWRYTASGAWPVFGGGGVNILPDGRAALCCGCVEMWYGQNRAGRSRSDSTAISSLCAHSSDKKNMTNKNNCVTSNNSTYICTVRAGGYLSHTATWNVRNSFLRACRPLLSDPPLFVHAGRDHVKPSGMRRSTPDTHLGRSAGTPSRSYIRRSKAIAMGHTVVIVFYRHVMRLARVL